MLLQVFSSSRKCDRILLQRMFPQLTDHRRPSTPTSTHLPPGAVANRPLAAEMRLTRLHQQVAASVSSRWRKRLRSQHISVFSLRSQPAIILASLSKWLSLFTGTCFYSESLRVTRTLHLAGSWSLEEEIHQDQRQFKGGSSGILVRPMGLLQGSLWSVLHLRMGGATQVRQVREELTSGGWGGDPQSEQKNHRRGTCDREKRIKKGKMTHFKLKHEIKWKIKYVLFLSLKSLTWGILEGYHQRNCV